MLHRALLVFVGLTSAMAIAQGPPVVKVSALSDGRLLLNGQPADIGAIKAELRGLVKCKANCSVNEARTDMAEKLERDLGFVRCGPGFR